MYKLTKILLVFHVMVTMKVQSVTLDWRLARCLVSKPALFFYLPVQRDRIKKLCSHLLCIKNSTT